MKLSRSANLVNKWAYKNNLAGQKLAQKRSGGAIFFTWENMLVRIADFKNRIAGHSWPTFFTGGPKYLSKNLGGPNIHIDIFIPP